MARGRTELHVVAGALFDDDGRVLLAQRPVGKHMAGRWEFPGGKLAERESPLDGLGRELAEELGIELEHAEPLIRLHHDYPDRRVLLDVWRVTSYRGQPRNLDAQALEWVKPDNLHTFNLLEADRPIITALRLPQVAVAAEGLEGLRKAAGRDEPRVLFWSPGDCAPSGEDAREAVRGARRRGHKVIVVGEGIEVALAAAGSGADGMLLKGRARLSVDPSGSFLVGEVCPTPAAASAAVAAGTQFLVLAPGGETVDEKQVCGILAGLGVPAYVGWFPDEGALDEVRGWGAHGCALGPPAADT
jgi:8-oxo-dGTP diphosphatase